MKKKNNLGQFFTTNSNYIIGNLLQFIPNNSIIVDPFAGNWDLLNLFSDTYEKYGFDIDPKNNKTTLQNTLLDVPNYNKKFVVTNPPYLAKNKNNLSTNKNKFKNINKNILEKFNVNDLYKAALKSIMGCNGGILIIPINFFCEENSKIRDDFLSKFYIKKLNIFEESVFEDTSYSVCSFYFEKASQEITNQKINIEFFPSKKIIQMEIDKVYNFRLAGDFYSMLNINSNISVSRLIDGDIPNSNIKLRALDSGSMDGRISLSIDDYYFDTTKNKTERAFCTLKFNHKFSKKEQQFIVDEFNNMLENYREKYNSLFLTGFRNSSKHYARKRIGFETVYKLVQFVIEKNKSKFNSLK